MPFVGDRSLVLLNWSGSADSAQTTAHELGHAYHNTTLAERTPLQRRLPMALAETASIFCETLVVESGLAAPRRRRAAGAARRRPRRRRTRSSSTSTAASCSRREVFARRQRRTLGVDRAQRADARGARPTPTATGSTSRRRTRTCGCSSRTTTARTSTTGRTPTACCSASGCSPATATTPSASAPATTTLLSRAGMDTAEELGAAFGLDVTDEAFWTASLDVLRGRIAEYERARRRALARTRRDRRPATTSTATSSPSCSPASRATGSTRCGRGCTRSLRDPAEMTQPAARRCATGSTTRCRRRSTPVTESVSDDGDTVKFLWALDGGSRIETVLMLYPDRATVCVSSQAGCAMGCGFCATGQAGFDRHLTTGEIVEQVVRRRAPGPGGRPPAEQRRVHGHGRAAGQRGRGVGAPSSASTTTSACRPATSRSRRSASCPASAASPTRPLPVNLAVSLHAANDALRDELVPINRRYPLDAAARRRAASTSTPRAGGSASSGR